VCVSCGRPTSSATPGVQDSRELPGTQYGIPSLVCGIVCWVFSFWLWPVGAVVAIAAIVLGAMGVRRRGRGLAVAGIALGGLFLSELLFYACLGVALFSAGF